MPGPDSVTAWQPSSSAIWASAAYSSLTQSVAANNFASRSRRPFITISLIAAFRSTDAAQIEASPAAATRG